MNKKHIFAAAIVCLICSVLFTDAVKAGATDGEYIPKYTEERLYEIYNEIVADYMSDYTQVPIVMACGVCAAEINGVVTGFGESGTEKRVVVSVRYQYYEEYKKMLEAKYGDAVYVEYTQDSKDAAEAAEIVFDDGDGQGATEGSDTGEDTSDKTNTDGESGKSGRGNSTATQVVVGVLLVAAAVAGFYVFKRKK